MKLNDSPPLTFGSLFAGIGGIDLGLERAGMICRFQVEIDDYATRVLAKHWPDVPRFRDVREVGAHNLPAVDLLAGGFPCQDISNAGRRTGIAGRRSGLWAEFYRIICQLRPRYIFVENVSALLVRGMGRVLGDLAACGYDAEWQCIPAAAVGAPHIRDRIFILAHTDNTERRADAKRRHLTDRTDTGWQETPGRSAIRRSTCRTAYVADTHSQRCDGRAGVFQATVQAGRLFTKRDNPWVAEPDVGRVAYGVSDRMDRLRGLGNAVVPQVAEFIGHLIVEYDTRNA